MEYRKIIRFGNASYAICLPKDWVEKNNLKKGQGLCVEDSGTGEITLSPKIIETEQEKKGITLDTNNKDIYCIKREIVSAYINNFRNIVITGNNLNEKALGIREIVNELVALEIMEQTNKRMIAKDFLDMDNISLPNTVRKIDMTLRATMYDIKNMLTEQKTVTEISQSRDKDINRLSLLCIRAIRYGINNPAFMKKSRITPQDLLDTYQIITFIEKTGDEIKRFAKEAEQLYDTTEMDILTTALTLFGEIEAIYIQALKAYYKHDRALAFEAAKTRALLKNNIETFSLELAAQKKNNHVAEKLITMLNSVHDITRVSYQ